VTFVQGGHRLSGRWDFSSGARHANWFAAATVVDGTLTASMMPRHDVTLIDAWDVQGLRGTGSFSFDVVDVFVPARRAFRFHAPTREPGALYRIPSNLLFAAGFAAVALGNARAALDAATDLLGAKTAVFDHRPVRERASVQLDVARAEAGWGAARAYLKQCAEALWVSAEHDDELSVNGRVALRLASTHAIHCAAEAVQIVYRVCGSTAIFSHDPLQRRFQDAHVITQQVQGRTAHYETVGQHLLGMDPKPWFF
jgi:alkylation response protein AidB-like acyl-CoA dehydrogenase